MSAGYLLDTSALSLLAPGRQALPQAEADRLRRHTDHLFIPTIALAEIREGICKLRRRGSVARADELDRWFKALGATYGDRILPFGMAAADAAGMIADRAVAIGRHPGFTDVAIAATALAGDLVVVTENLRHFEPLGIAAIDFAGLP